MRVFLFADNKNNKKQTTNKQTRHYFTSLIMMTGNTQFATCSYTRTPVITELPEAKTKQNPLMNRNQHK